MPDEAGIRRWLQLQLHVLRARRTYPTDEVLKQIDQSMGSEPRPLSQAEKRRIVAQLDNPSRDGAYLLNLRGRAKVSEILRRVTAAASVTTFLLASCGSSSTAQEHHGDANSSQPIYDAAIQEGQTAAQELINQGASAVAIALVDDKRIIWSQGFGLVDRDTGQMPTETRRATTSSLCDGDEGAKTCQGPQPSRRSRICFRSWLCFSLRYLPRFEHAEFAAQGFNIDILPC